MSTTTEIGARFFLVTGLKSLVIGAVFTAGAMAMLLLLAATFHLDPEKNRDVGYITMAVIAYGGIPLGMVAWLLSILRDMVSEERRETRILLMKWAISSLITLVIYTATVYGIAAYFTLDFVSSRCWLPKPTEPRNPRGSTFLYISKLLFIPLFQRMDNHISDCEFWIIPVRLFWYRDTSHPSRFRREYTIEWVLEYDTLSRRYSELLSGMDISAWMWFSIHFILTRVDDMEIFLDLESLKYCLDQSIIRSWVEPDFVSFFYEKIYSFPISWFSFSFLREEFHHFIDDFFCDKILRECRLIPWKSNEPIFNHFYHFESNSLAHHIICEMDTDEGKYFFFCIFPKWFWVYQKIIHIKYNCLDHISR